MAQHAWNALSEHITELQTLGGVQGLLGWDQQVHMPSGGAAARGAQSALMARIAHAKATDPRVMDWLDTLADADLTPTQATAVSRARFDTERARRVPGALAEALARGEADGFGAWMTAKTTDDFDAFAPTLTHLIALTREKAAAIDSDRHPYDVLLDDFDRGTTVATLRPLFARLREGLGELVSAVADRPAVPDLDTAFDPNKQATLHRDLVQSLGYDLTHGRVDVAEHPFTIGLSREDVRITTHLYERDVLKGLSGTVHEAGHAMYEQGLPAALHGTGLDAAASFGLHESQSRLWENFIGGSLPFLQWFAERMGTAFPQQPLSADTLYRTTNRIQPGLIRIAADEVTYNLHIIVRFELEVALLQGDLAVADLPGAWNDAYDRVLGVRPQTHAEGVLQDVHWSGGAFAYFPSYTLGNLYAASFGATLERDVPAIWDHVRAGDFAPVLAWLRTNVHRHGHTQHAPDIVRDAVGDRDHVDDLLSYLWTRHGALYGVQRP